MNERFAFLWHLISIFDFWKESEMLLAVKVLDLKTFQKSKQGKFGGE